MAIHLTGTGVSFTDEANDASGMVNEVLDDFERGTWTATLPNGGSIAQNKAEYSKVAQTVWVFYYGNFTPTDNSSSWNIGGLPYSSVSQGHCALSFSYTDSHNTSHWAPGLLMGGANNYFYAHRSDGNGDTIKNGEWNGQNKPLIMSGWYMSTS